MLPVFIWNSAGPWAGLIAYIDRMNAMSSTCCAMFGKRSETSIPDWPYFLNVQGDGIRPPGLPITVRTGPTPFIVSPCHFTRSGFGSKVSIWLTPP